jgi:hypothetical protein
MKDFKFYNASFACGNLFFFCKDVGSVAKTKRMWAMGQSTCAK